MLEVSGYDIGVISEVSTREFDPRLTIGVILSLIDISILVRRYKLYCKLATLNIKKRLRFILAQ